jgi:hypothetical protein
MIDSQAEKEAKKIEIIIDIHRRDCWDKEVNQD